MAGLGIDRLVVVPFDARLAALSPEAFAREVLQQGLAARHVVVGDSFRFGRARAGDPALLEALGAAARLRRRGGAARARRRAGRSAAAGCARRSRAATWARRASCSAASISSTARWCAATAGAARSACRRRTSRRRRRSCRRTASTRCAAARGDSWHPAVVNVGERPTFGGGRVTLEAHLIDFEGELYGARVRVAFHERLRGEQRFESAERLVAQIRADVAAARARLPPAAGPAV